MKYKRSFVFVRENTSTAFYSDTTNFLHQLRSIMPPSIAITAGRHGNDTEYISFWFEEFADYDWHTDNLYVSGDLKAVFRQAMIYAKQHRLAFAMPSVNLQNTPTKGITRWWYYNLKPLEEKFYDSTPGQKQALQLLTNFMALPCSVHSVTVFDYDHCFKYTENAVTPDITVQNFEKKLNRLRLEHFEQFKSDKDVYNVAHRIRSHTQTDCVDRTSSDFNLEPVKNIVPANFANFVLNLESL